MHAIMHATKSTGMRTLPSDFTRVGVTQGVAANGVSLLFLEKVTTFLVTALWKVMTFFS